MLQKEVALKFDYNEPKMNKYKLHTKITSIFNKCFDVSPNVFIPKPKVNSTLIKISPHGKYKNMRMKYDLLQKILSVCFANPRKKILSSLKKIDLGSELFSFDLNKRPEELEINNFFEILNLYESKL